MEIVIETYLESTASSILDSISGFYILHGLYITSHSKQGIHYQIHYEHF